MLSPRYTYDHRPILPLNPLQRTVKDQVEDKVRLKVYKLEKVPCVICGGTEFEPLSAKDRYGLYFPVVICPACGLVQTNPRMDAASYRNFYKEEYRKLYVGHERPTEAFFQKQVRHGMKIMAYLRRHRAVPLRRSDPLILEVGCGAGGILKYFQDQGCRVKGIDPDAAYTAYGREVHGLDLAAGTLDTLQLDTPPDLIIYSHVMEHLLDPAAEINQLHRLLPDQGRLYIEVPSIKNLWGNYYLDFLRLLQNAHTYHFSLRSLTNLVQAQPFTRITGDEKVRSVFAKSDTGSVPPAFENDYADARRCLHRAERLRPLIPAVVHEVLRRYHYYVEGR